MGIVAIMGTRTTARRGAAAGALALVAAALLGRLPLTSASFTATTGSGGNSFAAASSFCAAPGSSTANLLNDTMVSQGSPTTNYVSATTLEVRSQPSNNRRILVRPALPALPARCRVTSAVLTFSVSSYKAGRTYQAYRIATDWTVGTVTWNTQPPTTGTPATATVTNGTWSIGVASQVQAIYDSGTNTGLLVRDATEDAAPEQHNTYSSLDGSTPPTLTLTWG